MKTFSIPLKPKVSYLLNPSPSPPPSQPLSSLLQPPYINSFSNTYFYFSLPHFVFTSVSLYLYNSLPILPLPTYFRFPLFALPCVQTLRRSSKALARSGVVGLHNNHSCHLVIVIIKVWPSSNCSSGFITTKIG